MLKNMDMTKREQVDFLVLVFLSVVLFLVPFLCIKPPINGWMLGLVMADSVSGLAFLFVCGFAVAGEYNLDRFLFTKIF